VNLTYADILEAIKQVEAEGYSATFTIDNKLIITGKPKKLKEKVQFT
jgi:hypothetical protein